MTETLIVEEHQHSHQHYASEGKHWQQEKIPVGASTTAVGSQHDTNGETGIVHRVYLFY